MERTEPALKYIELYEQLVALQNDSNDSGRVINEVALHRIQNEAQKLQKVDAAHAYMLLGMISALKGEKDQAIEYHNKSLKLRPNEQLLLLVKANTLLLLNQPDAAFSIYDPIIAETNDIDTLSQLLNLKLLWHPRRSIRCLDRLLQLRGNLTQEEREMRTRFELQVQSGLADSAIYKIMYLTYNVLAEFGLGFKAAQHIWLDQITMPDVPCVVHWIGVDTDVDTIVAMNQRLSELKVAELKTGRYVVGFKHPKEQHHKDEDDDWDRQMKADAEAGKLDFLIQDALDAYENGEVKFL